MHAFARSIVETVRHPLLVLDAGLRVVGANASYYRTFGGAPDATEGRSLFDTDGGRWANADVRARLADVIPGNSSFKDVEVGYDAPDAVRRVVVLDAHRVVREDDGAAMILLAIEDNTERRHALAELHGLNAGLERRVADRTAALEGANRELREVNRELASANRELEAFSFSVSHDLRTPLRALDGFSRELLQGYAGVLDEQGRHYLTRVRAGTQRMGLLIDDMLKLSRVTRATMLLEPTDLTALAESVVAELREREPGRAVTFTARPGLTATCDPRLMRVALENLLGNAWKFTAKNPAAVVAFDRPDAADPTGRAAFVVRDDGAGFDMAFAGKLFGAFQRLHSDREFPGTGIGLATVQRVVRRHGGDVRAEGAVGRGASFYFTLPGPETPRER